MDNLLDMAILEYRDIDNGDILRQYPSESQIRAFQRAAELEEKGAARAEATVSLVVETDAPAETNAPQSAADPGAAASPPSLPSPSASTPSASVSAPASAPSPDQGSGHSNGATSQSVIV
jgi:hypothetical protein